ncbi:MAG TPA: ATPase inhibitor subunit zeta, partial [Pseudolabrys sp.]|nr:ATPase inhibitor subunit zeta [Pseudolabrys sp.]
KEVVLADFEESGDSDVMRKVAKDLEPKGISEQQIRAQMTELLAAAIEQIKKSG